MNFKFKSLVAAVALSAVAVSAQAEISSGSNSELFFNAWDGTNGYTFDLTSVLALNDIVGGADLTVNAGNNTTTISRIPSYIGAGVVFDGALTGFGTSFSSTSGVEWNLGAFDATGRRRLISTQDITSSGALLSTNDQVALSANTMNAFVAQANSKMVDATIGVDSYANTVLGDLSAYSGNYGVNWTNSVGDSTNLMGVTSNLFFYAQASTSDGLGAPLFSQLGLSARTYLGTNNEWRLELAGLPAVNPNPLDPVAAVPEPESYAMMLAGLALMGGVARRRNNKA